MIPAYAPIQHIEVDEEGIPRTVNHHVKVSMIAQKYEVAGESVEGIADQYGVSPADVYAALAYFYDNREWFAEREVLLAPLAQEARRYSADLKARIDARLKQQHSME